MSTGAKTRARLPIGLRIVHWVILGNFLVQMAYASYMIFFVVKPEGMTGALMGRAAELPFEMMVTRRLYAIEFWIATAGFAIYLALTEILPRLWPRLGEASSKAES